MFATTMMCCIEQALLPLHSPRKIECYSLKKLVQLHQHWQQIEELYKSLHKGKCLKQAQNCVAFRLGIFMCCIEWAHEDAIPSWMSIIPSATQTARHSQFFNETYTTLRFSVYLGNIKNRVKEWNLSQSRKFRLYRYFPRIHNGLWLESHHAHPSKHSQLQQCPLLIPELRLHKAYIASNKRHKDLFFWAPLHWRDCRGSLLMCSDHVSQTTVLSYICWRRLGQGLCWCEV